MKKQLALLLALCLLLALGACGTSQPGDSAASGSSEFGNAAAPAETAAPVTAPPSTEPSESKAPGAVAEANEDASIPVSFDAGGGSGTMDAVSVKPNSEYTLPECGFTAPEGTAFGGWEIGDSTYMPGDTVTVTEDMLLIALWQSTETEQTEAAPAEAEPAQTETALPVQVRAPLLATDSIRMVTPAKMVTCSQMAMTIPS